MTKQPCSILPANLFGWWLEFWHFKAVSKEIKYIIFTDILGILFEIYNTQGFLHLPWCGFAQSKSKQALKIYRSEITSSKFKMPHEDETGKTISIY